MSLCENGLSVRANNSLNYAGISDSKADVIDALRAGILVPNKLKPRNYGKKTHAEICKWAGVSMEELGKKKTTPPVKIMKCQGYCYKLPDTHEMKNRKVGVGRFESGHWYLYGEHDGKRQEIGFTADAMEHIMGMICKVLINAPQPKGEI